MTTLADTSVWIDGLRRDVTWLSTTLAASHTVAYTEPVLMELLIGARSEPERETLRRFVSGGRLLPFDAVADFEGAAAINWVGRRRGITVGKVDCLILAVAQRTDTALATRDRRQAELGRMIGIDIAA
jgi:predicted nucleic acid-binding protein